MKILGAIELWGARFHYRQDTVFNAATYLAFLEQLARCYRRQGAILIQDNASYHKDADVWHWFASNRHWLDVHQLPPYSPEFNPTERLWQHTRKTGTHNRYFATETELVGTLSRVFARDAIPPGTDPLVSAPFLLTIMSFYLCADVYSPGKEAQRQGTRESKGEAVGPRRQ